MSTNQLNWWEDNFIGNQIRAWTEALANAICKQRDCYTLLVWYGLVWFGMVWFGLVWFGMVWFDLLLKTPGLYLVPELRYPWFGLVWYDLVWYGLV